MSEYEGLPLGSTQSLQLSERRWSVSGVFRVGESEEFIRAATACFAVRSRRDDIGSSVLFRISPQRKLG